MFQKLFIRTTVQKHTSWYKNFSANNKMFLKKNYLAVCYRRQRFSRGSTIVNYRTQYWFFTQHIFSDFIFKIHGHNNCVSFDNKSRVKVIDNCIGQLTSISRLNTSTWIDSSIIWLIIFYIQGQLLYSHPPSLSLLQF